MTAAEDLPADWLEAYSVLVSEDHGDPDARLANKIAAIYRMRDIEEREGRHLTAAPGEALAELERRKDPDGSKRRAARIDALTAERAELEAKIPDYRNPLPPLLRRLKAIRGELGALAGPADRA